jgi:parallel beta-helix repeat protein
MKIGRSSSASRIIIVVALLSFSILSQVPPGTVGASPVTLLVPQQYPTIQAAVTASAPGDTIIVSSGTYTENVIIRNSLTLTGAGNSSTFIDGQGHGPGISIVAANGINISGFTIKNPGADNSTVLVISSLRVAVSHNVIQGFSKQSNGTTIYNSNGIAVVNNLVTGNLYGIAIQGGFGNTVQGDNSTGNAVGIGIFNSTGNIVKLNSFRYGSEGVRIWYQGSTGNLVARNMIANNSIAGISLLGSGGNRIIGNEVAFNHISSTSEGIYLSSSTGNSVYYNSIRNNTIQMFAVSSADMNGSVWNDGGVKPKGNFWSNYNGTDADGDGIGDTQLPWPCPRGGQPCTSFTSVGVDKYPLMNPWTFSSVNVTAIAQPFSGCPLILNVSFSGLAQKGLPPYGYSWSFGDGSGQTGQNVTHVYSGKGAFFATLTATDSSGANGTDIVPITVFSGGLVLHVVGGGTSVSSANVSSISQPPGQARLNQLTNAQGIVAFPCLALGPYVVQISRSGYQTAKSGFNVGNQTASLTVTLTPITNGWPIVLLVGIGTTALLAGLFTVLLFRRRRRRVGSAQGDVISERKP